MTTETAPAVHGRADDRFDGVRVAFAGVLADNSGGVNLSVYEHGREVINLFGGHSAGGEGEFTADSLVMTASCSKGVTTICALMLADAGLLDIDAPVAEYWPEFAARGKTHIPVRWLLTHRAGLPVLDPAAGLRAGDLLDWDRVVDTLAGQEPLWEPGRYCGYHALTFGYLVGEVIRRVAGITVGTYLRERVAGPLGAEFWIGLPEEHEHRVRPNVVPAPSAGPGLDLRALFTANGLDLESPLATAMLAPSSADDGPGDALWNSRPFRAAEVPAANGIGTARGLARLYAGCIGEVDGTRLLSAEAVTAARTPNTDDVPTVAEFAVLTSLPPRFGVGFQLPRPEMDIMLGAGSFGHTGAGGRLGFAHPERGVSFGFTCDTMMWDGLTGPDPRWPPLLQAIAEALD